LIEAGRLDPGSGWRAIVLASLSNLVFKGVLGSALGGRALMKHLAPLFLTSIAAGITVLLLWH